MKIAITGGAGFIASNIADAYIKLGHDVSIIDNLSTGFMRNVNSAAHFYNIDITTPELTKLFEQEHFDFVSHHAAQMNVRFSVANPLADASTNILGSINICEACVRTGVKKIVFASSGGTVYGEQSEFPAPEEHRLNPCSPYGISKVSVEKYLFYYKNVLGLDNCIFRYGNVFGPRQNPHAEAGVIAIFIDKMLAGEQPVINGDGGITRDYIYIADVVKANCLALQPEVSGTFNVAAGIETSVNTIFKKLKALTGSPCEEFHGPAKAGEQRRSVCSIEKFRKLHGWVPDFTFDAGLAKTLEYARKK